MILRGPRDGNFTIVNNEIFDAGLSPEATGLLCYLLSKPDDWQVIPAQLREQFGLGRDKTYELIGELLAHGYMVRRKHADGSIDYIVLDRRQPDPGFREEGRPDPGMQEQAKPDPEKPEQGPSLILKIRNTEKPDPEKPDALLKTDREPKKERKRPKTERARAQGTPLPENWQPDESDREYGASLGLSDKQVEDAAESMRLWAGANANRPIARKVNWHLAFKSWLRRDAVEKPRPQRRSLFDVSRDLAQREMKG